jgi:iron complex outermembrane recepter protein
MAATPPPAPSSSQTLRPGAELEGGVRASYAEQNTIEADAYVAAPIGDTLGFVLSGYYRSTDGFWTNSFLDERSSTTRKSGAWTAACLWQLGDRTELDIKSRYADLSGASINYNTSVPPAQLRGSDPAFYEDVNEHPFNYYGNIRPTNDADVVRGLGQDRT